MNALMEPLYIVVSAIMVAFHSMFERLGLDPASGVTWSLSIIGLVVVIRILLIPLFVKQIKAQRGLQQLQPEIKKIQERYKGDRERTSQELMKLYKTTGTNPLSSCLPILAQAPIFFALFGVLNGIASYRVGENPRGVLTPELDLQARNAEVFGVKVFDTFLGAYNTAFRVVALLLIVLMSATTFYTQKQLMTKNMPASAMTGPFAQQQKILLYVFPVVFAVTGVNFPIGVLIYWFTTNVWTLGQQLYVINRMPAPGSPAYESMQRRRAAKTERHQRRGGDQSGLASSATVEATPDASSPNGSKARANGATRLSPAGSTDGASPDGDEPSVRPSRQRQQPRRQPRSRRR